MSSDGDAGAAPPPADDAQPPRRVRRPPKLRDDAPVLPSTASDEVGWGDDPAERDDEWYRRERPPHHE